MEKIAKHGTHQVLSDDEIDTLVMSLAKSQSRAGTHFTTQEAEKVVEWATQARVDSGLLHNVLSGRVLVGVDRDSDELVFGLSDERRAVLTEEAT